MELADFETAKDKVFMGPERKSMIMTEKEKQNTAVHEAGHALVGKLLPGCDPVHKVTIIPRGQALGITWSLPTEDQLNRYRKQLKDELSMLLGGRVAEELVFDEMSAGAANDIERATQIARAMVCRWGMSDKLGPLSYSNREGEVFLGRDFAARPDHSDETAKNIDEEVRTIVVGAYERTKALLSENLELLKRISDALVEYETLDAEDLEVLMQGGPLTREKPPPRLTAPPPTEEKKNRNILDSIDGLNMELEKA
jgi:cell division protease FtsH